MSSKRNLLLCLDAFGTIFTPRESIAAQYGGVARSFGVKIGDEQVGKAFKHGMFVRTSAEIMRARHSTSEAAG